MKVMCVSVCVDTESQKSNRVLNFRGFHTHSALHFTSEI